MHCIAYGGATIPCEVSDLKLQSSHALPLQCTLTVRQKTYTMAKDNTRANATSWHSASMMIMMFHHVVRRWPCCSLVLQELVPDLNACLQDISETLQALHFVAYWHLLPRWVPPAAMWDFLIYTAQEHACAGALVGAGRMWGEGRSGCAALVEQCVSDTIPCCAHHSQVPWRHGLPAG